MVSDQVGVKVQAGKSKNKVGMIPFDKKLQVGDRVERTLGVELKGTITDPFPWRQQNDGAYGEPNRGCVPVQWDNGTKGYISPVFLTALTDTELAIEEVARQAKQKSQLQESIKDALRDTEDFDDNWYDTFLANQT